MDLGLAAGEGGQDGEVVGGFRGGLVGEFGAEGPPLSQKAKGWAETWLGLISPGQRARKETRMPPSVRLRNAALGDNFAFMEVNFPIFPTGIIRSTGDSVISIDVTFCRRRCVRWTRLARHESK